jgi:hypothetical protein
MKFISIRNLSGKSAQVWKELPVEKEMVEIVYTDCISRSGQFGEQVEIVGTKQVTIHDKKIRQLLMYIETVCVCRFIQTV